MGHLLLNRRWARATNPGRSRRLAECVGLIVLAAAISFPISAPAQVLTRPVNLAFLARRADLIVQGRVVEARYEGLPNYPHVSTVLVTLEVERMLRGPDTTRYTFRQYVPGGQRALKGDYTVGQRVLLFLPAPSLRGLSSPLALEQGHFRIVPGRSGQELIVNQRGNVGLFEGLPETAARAGITLDEDHLRLVSRTRGAVPVRDFVSLVERLMLLPRNE
jgi:hypothetical protein